MADLFPIDMKVLAEAFFGPEGYEQPLRNPIVIFGSLDVTFTDEGLLWFDAMLDQPNFVRGEN